MNIIFIVLFFLLMLVGILTIVKRKSILKIRLIKDKKIFLLIFRIFSFLLAFVCLGSFVFNSFFSNVPLTTMKNETNNGYSLVFPQKINGNLHNPGEGWVAIEEPTYAGHSNLGADGDIPMVDNISLSSSWALIETAEGVFDWSNVDRTVDYWAKKGKYINLRITTDTLVLPYTSEGAPPWLIEKYSIKTKQYRFDGTSPIPTYEAIDVTDENYLRYLDIFLNEMKNHFKGNKAVDTVEILGFGVWGEWHSGIDFISYEDRNNALKTIINKYVNAYKELNISMVISAAWEYRDDLDPNVSVNQYPKPTYEEYLHWSAFDYAMTLDGVSFRRNAGAGALKYDYDRRLFSDYIRSNKREPLMAEYYSNFDDQIKANPVFNVMEGIDDILFQLRPNNSTVLGWANTNVQKLYDLGYGYLYERGNEKLGYRLSIDKARFPKGVKQNSQFSILTTFSNTSVGRYFYDYPIMISFIDDKGEIKYSQLNKDANLKTLVNGETLDVYTNITIPNEIADGNYKIALSIVDNDNKPCIALGNGGDNNDKIYVLGNVNISANNSAVTPIEKKLTFEELKNYNLKANTAYRFTFNYTPKFDLKNYKFGNYDGYEVFAQSAKGGEDARVGYNKWQDVSGEKSLKTICFKTDSFSDYKLNITSSNFGEIEIGDCILEETSGYLENFAGDYKFYNTND